MKAGMHFFQVFFRVSCFLFRSTVTGVYLPFPICSIAFFFLGVSVAGFFTYLLLSKGGLLLVFVGIFLVW